SSRRRHTRFSRDWSSDVCSSDLNKLVSLFNIIRRPERPPVIQTLGGGQQLDREDAFDIRDDLAKFYGRRHAHGNVILLAAGSWRSEERRVGKVWRYGWAECGGVR